MDRIIEVKVNGNYLTKDNRLAGVKGEANVTALRITFDEAWDGYAKKVVWWDAYGENPVTRTLTADLLEDVKKSALVYLCPIPGEPLAEAGECQFVIEGYLDGKRQRSAGDTLLVKDAPYTNEETEPVDPTPSRADQLQREIELILPSVMEQARAATNAASEAKESAERSADKAESDANDARRFLEQANSAAVMAGIYAEAAENASGEALDEARELLSDYVNDAKQSAEAAAASTESASAAAGVAETSKAEAVRAANEAANSLRDAKIAANNTVMHATTAQLYVGAAEDAKTAAETAATDAKASKLAAVASEEAASSSASAASSSASAAAQSETKAAASEQNAAASETAAKSAQAAAEKARDEAQQAAGGDFATPAYVDSKAGEAESNAKSYTDQKFAAIPTPDVSGQINTHNTATDAHADIRQAVSAAASAAAAAQAKADGALPLSGGTLSGALDFSNSASWITPYLLAFKNADLSASPEYPYTGFYQWGNMWEVNARNGNNDHVKTVLGIDLPSGVATFCAVPTVGGAPLALASNVPSKTESWTFTLEDGSTVTKAVYVG